MYTPPHFLEDRVEVLHALMRNHPLASLVTLSPDGLIANHIPLLLDPSPEPNGTLRGHVARANPVWHISDLTVAALAIFHGPDAYITPSWYAAKAETGRVVPTWNYAAVHAHGPLRIVDDTAWLEANVRALTARHEAGFAPPWSPDDAPPGYLQGLLKGIVGIEIQIARLEGKWKVSQNRPESDHPGIVSGLEATGYTDMAKLVGNRRPRGGR